MKVLSGRWVLWLVLGGLLMAAVDGGINLWAFKRLEKKAGAPLRGDFQPHLFQSSFTLKDARLDWQGRFQVLSGNLNAFYDPLSLLPGRRFRVRVMGKELKARLGREWAEDYGISEVTISRVEADLAFARKGPPEVFYFDVQSPQIQFHWAKK